MTTETITPTTPKPRKPREPKMKLWRKIPVWLPYPVIAAIEQRVGYRKDPGFTRSGVDYAIRNAIINFLTLRPADARLTEFSLLHAWMDGRQIAMERAFNAAVAAGDNQESAQVKAEEAARRGDGADEMACRDHGALSNYAEDRPGPMLIGRLQCMGMGNGDKWARYFLSLLEGMLSKEENKAYGPWTTTLEQTDALSSAVDIHLAKAVDAMMELAAIDRKKAVYCAAAIERYAHKQLAEVLEQRKADVGIPEGGSFKIADYAGTTGGAA
jgi:hypothetical protein